MSKYIAYLRISTNKQDLKNQKLEVLDYAYKNNIKIDEFVEVQSSSRKSSKERMLDVLLSKLNKGDALVVSELSRLGRSLGNIFQIVDELITNGIKLTTIKENIQLNPQKRDIQTKVMITLFGLFSEIERDLISERTKQGLQTAKDKGKILGRPKGILGKSLLDGKEFEIKEYLNKKVSKSSIAKILGVSRTCLYDFIKSRNLD
jgi:DNA invertase Pin-like site-specific DNA recombinase